MTKIEPTNAPPDVVGRLSGIRSRGNGYQALCPAHPDQQASLSIDTGEDGRVLLHCFAGCTAEQIVSALGLTLADLFPRNGHGRKERGMYTPLVNTSTRQRSPGCTLEQYAQAKRLPVDFLKSVGLSDTKYLDLPSLRIPYLDESGQEVAVRYRIALEKSEAGDNRFRWKKGDKPCLYGLWRLNPKPESIVLVEGETDCHVLWYHGIPAVGVPGAANWREERDADHFDSIATIYVLVEPDRGGETVKRWLAKSKIRDRARLINLGEQKDPAGLYLADPEHFPERWQAALTTAVLWTDQQATETATQRATAWAQCKALAKQPRILDCFAQDLARCGVAGEQRIGKLLYLIPTTRYLQQPVSAAVKGPSSGGKSYLTECVLSFHPASAYYALSAMSERALAYSEEPLQHRFLVIYEAAGMQGDFAAYLLRSLLSEGRVRYETVEKTKAGLQAKLIEREGPTGLLVTTTAIKLHPENETRLLSLTVTDTPNQTHDILLALAEEGASPVDRTPWHALQTWLEGGEHRVTIPYAKVLAEKTPPVAVRLRRDFRAILSLIHAHAILHQATRRRDDEGCIIATVDDYAVVRELVHALIAEGVEATVPSTVRETVEAVKRLLATGKGDVSVAQLAQALKLDKAAVSRRVRVAIDRGFLQNLETKRGLPARLVSGDPLPEEQPVLPPPEEVLTCCSVDEGGIHPLPPPSPEQAEDAEVF